MIAGLILAAGESSRMGRDKALLLYRGQTFLENIISTLRASGIERIVVVLGHHAQEIRQGTKLEGVEVAVNAQYQLGQTSSLKAGLAVLDGPEIEAVLLCLADHPAVKADTVRTIIEAFKSQQPAVVVPTFRGRRGHPVLISRQLFPELLALGPDIGANTIIRNYTEGTQLLPVDDAGVLTDVDEPASYESLLGR